MQDKYDPMTGELLSEKKAEDDVVRQYDPMTGEPLSEKKAEDDAVRQFDPMTGEPLSEKKAEDNAERRYDPMTGELLSEKKAEDNAGWQFDPMTGKALSGKKAKDDSKWQFDPMTGKPVKKKKGKVIKAAAVIIVLAVVVFAGFKSGLFLSKGSKVLNAAKNTVDIDSHLVNALKKVSILRSNNYTVEYQMEDSEDNIYVDVTYARSPQKKWMEGNIGSDDYGFDFMAELTSSQLRVKFPDQSDRVFTYNYQENKTGYITKYVNDDMLESIDNMLNTLYSEKEQKALGREILGVIRQEYRSLEFKTIDKRAFNINGKKRDCKGYSTTITSDNMVDLLRAIKDVCEDEYEYLLDAMEYTDLINEFRDMPDIEAAFYLYRNRLACINLESDGEYVRVMFDGDGKKEQSVRVSADGENVLELKKTEKNTQERYSVAVEDEEVLEVEYDYKSGDYVLEVYDSYFNEAMTVEGRLVADSGGLKASVDEVSTYWGAFDPGINLAIRKGASPGELDGEEFNIGDATEKDFLNILEELYDYFD